MNYLTTVSLSFLLVACGTRGPAAMPSSGAILPNTTVQLAPHVGYTVEGIVGGAAVGALLYYVYDPLAPNWSIEERVLNEDTYALSLKAKSFRTGGDGEALQIMKRRAQALQYEKGYTSYRILNFTQGIESSTPFTHAYSEGTIQLVRAGGAPGR